MAEKIKVIHVEHCSHSYFLKNPNDNPDDIVKGSWGTQVVREIKKYYPDIEVECWFPEKKEKKEREFHHWNVRLRIFPTTFSPKYALDFSIPMLSALKQEIKKCKENGKKLIIHIHEYHNLHGLAIAYLFKDQRLIAQHHGGSSPSRHLKRNKKYKLFLPFFLLGQFIENRVLKNIRYFYALSNEEIEYLRKIAPNSIIRFQTMGIEDEYFNNFNKEKARKTLKINNNEKILLYIGRISEEKGIKYLIDAMKDIKEVKLKVIGYLQDLDKFKNYSKSIGANNIEFLGGVFGEKKMLWLSASDCLILPSLKEGAPVVVMEAFARNLPVIITDVGGVRLMVENGKNGIIIKQRDSSDIIDAVNRFFRKPLKNVKKYAKVYKWKKIIDNTIKDYIEIR